VSVRGVSVREDFCLFSVWHSRVHYLATRTSFASTFDVSESPIRRISYAVPFVSIICDIILVVAEKSAVNSPSPQSKNSNARPNSETSNFDMKFLLIRKLFSRVARVAELLLLEDRHFTGKSHAKRMDWFTTRSSFA